jgi:two-component system response regulator YesN
MTAVFQRNLAMIEILIVDDEPLVLLTLRSLCDWETHGMHIIGEAENGKAALEFIGNHSSVDIILSDVDMPIMDGLELAETLKESGSDIPVVFLSSHSNFDYVRRALKSGAHDYILKSEMSEQSLLELIQRVVAKFVKREQSNTEISQEKESVRTALFASINDEDSQKENIDEIFERCGFKANFPFHFMILKPGDIPLVRTRYENNLYDFQKTSADLLKRFVPEGQGDCGAISFDEYYLFMTDAEKLENVFELFYKSAWTYLDIGFERKSSGPVSDASSFAGAFSACVKGFHPPSRIVIRSRRYIREHFSNHELDLAEIAQYSEVSKNHLSWEFARETGETISDFITRTRIQEAQKLIMETNLRIYEIAEKTGYQNVETFSRAFKKITGTSPSRFV